MTGYRGIDIQQADTSWRALLNRASDHLPLAVRGHLVRCRPHLKPSARLAEPQLGVRHFRERRRDQQDRRDDRYDAHAVLIAQEARPAKSVSQRSQSDKTLVRPT